MVRLGQDAFLNALTKFYGFSTESGSVVITFKKYVPKMSERTGRAQDPLAPSEHVEKPARRLTRLTTGRRDGAWLRTVPHNLQGEAASLTGFWLLQSESGH